MRRITGRSATKTDLAVTRLLPNPAQLEKRLNMTGKDWTVGKYGVTTAGVTVGVAALLMLKGLPILLALFVGLFAVATLVVLPNMLTWREFAVAFQVQGASGPRRRPAPRKRPQQSRRSATDDESAMSWPPYSAGQLGTSSPSAAACRAAAATAAAVSAASAGVVMPTSQGRPRRARSAAGTR